MIHSNKRQRWLLIPALALIIAAVSIGGCGDSASPEPLATEEPPAPNSLTIAANGSGTTDPAIGIHEYDSENVVSISAKPDLGYAFIGWTGDVATVENPFSSTITVTVDDDISVFANFVPDEPTTYLYRNQKWVEGFYAQPEGVNLEEIETVFWHVFSRLPDQIIVYPSENYYYYGLHIDGRQLWGNIRLATGYRDEGELSFAYFEFDEFASPGEGKFTQSKLFQLEDGVEIEKIDRFTYDVSYNGRTVTFNLHQLSQDPPNLFTLRENEVSVERTFDESGYQFFLMFNEEKNYFFWVLNEEEGVPDILDPIGETGDIFLGRRSGFAFWEDELGRKVLASIRQHSVTRNDYYDGPFDQLADNYAEEVNIKEYMIKANPAIKDRINEYGYYIFDQYGNPVDRPLRVAISVYQTYYTQSQFTQFIERAKASDDPYQFISRRGVPEATSSGTPSVEGS